MLKTRLSVKGISGLLSQGKEKKSKENEANGKAQPLKATHFDYITKQKPGGSSQDRPRAPKQQHPQGPDYPRSRSDRPRSDRPSREEKKYRHSTGQHRNGSSDMHHPRPETQRRYSREDDEEMLRIDSQRHRSDERSRNHRRSGSLPAHYSQDRGHPRGSSQPSHYQQSSQSTLRGPPKPPRRQESLNRVHVHESPETDVTSPSDYEVYSPSSGSSSPKNWRVSPLNQQHPAAPQHRRDRSLSPSKGYPRPSQRQERSPERRPRHYDNAQYDYPDRYKPRDVLQERYDKLYSKKPSRNGSKKDPSHYSQYPPENGHKQLKQPSKAQNHDHYSQDRKTNGLEDPYQESPYQQQWQNGTNSSQYEQVKDSQYQQSQVGPTSSARPLVIPNNDGNKEGPRPIYRSDGEIDLREQPRQKPQEQQNAPKYGSVPRSQSSSLTRRHTTDLNNYPDPYLKSEQPDQQWEDPNQQTAQNSQRQSNSLRTVRGVKAYDQHIKKYKRPASLEGAPRQQQVSSKQRRPNSGMDYPAPDEGPYPSLAHSKNSAFGKAPATIQQAYEDVQYAYDRTARSEHDIYNQHQYNYQNYGYKGYDENGYNNGMYRSNQPQDYDRSNGYRNGGSHAPRDWRQDRHAEMVVRSPTLPEPEEAANSVKQVDSGKQTIFCLVSQVVPTSPSPEVSPGPIEREFVEIENGKVSPLMKSPNKYHEHSQRHPQSHVRSQANYQSSQPDPRWEEHLKKREMRRTYLHSGSQDSSTGNESDTYNQQQKGQTGYQQSNSTKLSGQIVQKRASGNWNKEKVNVRGASVSSGYHSSPENERAFDQQRQKQSLTGHRFSDGEHRIEGTMEQGEVDDAPTVPVKDLIKKINKSAEENELPNQVLAVKRNSADLKTILMKDFEQSKQFVKESVQFAVPDFSDQPAQQDVPREKPALGKENSPPNAYYNEKYVTATASPADAVKTRRKAKTQERPCSVHFPVTHAVPQEDQVKPAQSEDDHEDRPMNAKQRRAYFESLKPPSREEEIQSVKLKASEEGYNDFEQTNAGSAQPNAVYGNINWPQQQQSAGEPAISQQRVFADLAKPVKAYLYEPAGFQYEDSSSDHQNKSGDRQAYYDKLRQRGQGLEQGMGRRSQSLPKLDGSSGGDLGEPSPARKSVEELQMLNGENRRLSAGALLFKQKQIEMDRHNKKQELLERVKDELRTRFGSQPKAQDESGDAVETLEQNKHLLTHVAGKRIRGRESADFEMALSKLQNIHSEADRDADEILHPQFYRPFDHRAAEIPLLAQKVAELQQLLSIHASAGSGKHRKVKRSTSDVTQMVQNTYEQDGDSVESAKSHDYCAHKQSDYAKKSSYKNGSGGGHDSTSDEEKSYLKGQGSNGSKLYRHPKSADNLGFSSDSSPERPIKVNPKIVLPDHIRAASPTGSDASGSSLRGQRKAARDAFFSGEEQSRSNSRGTSPLPGRRTPDRASSPHSPRNLAPVVKQSVRYTETPQMKKAVLTKPPPAPTLTKTKETQIHLQPPGNRDSVSTVDSAGLAQPFEDMTDEYTDMMMDHQAVDMSSPGDPDRTSSIESLIQLTSGSQPEAPPTDGHHRAAPGDCFAPDDDIPLADEEEISSDDESGGLEDLEVPDPSELKWETPHTYGPLTSEGTLHSHHSHREQGRHRSAPSAVRESFSDIGSVQYRDRSSNMSTRDNRSVTKLQEKYASDRPLSFESSLDRRASYAANPAGRSLKSQETEGGVRSGRYGQDRSGSGPAHSSHRSSVDYSSGGRAEDYGTAAADAKHSSHYAGMSHPRTASASDIYAIARHQSFQDDRGKLPGDLKRGSTESGYGSLEKEKIRRGTYTGSTAGETNPVNAIRDKYLDKYHPKASSNGDSARSYGKAPPRGDETRAVATPPMSVSDALARALHSGSESEETESRAARIAKYKEQRRRELAEKYGLSSSESESASRRKYPSKDETSPTSDRSRTFSNASDTGIPYPRRYASRESISSIPGEVDSIHTNGNTSHDNSPATTPRLSRKARRDSNISTETQEFIDALEASRAARRERLRRSETEDTSDPADRLIARHRRRKSSVDSSSDVFDSPNRSGSRDRRHDDISDSDSVTSSASENRPSRRHAKSDKADMMEAMRRQDAHSKPPPEFASRPQPESVLSSKPTRDKRKRHNQAISVEDIKKASKLSTTPEPSPEILVGAGSAKQVHPLQTSKNEAPGKDQKSSSRDSSPRKLKPGGFKIETVTKTDLKGEQSAPLKRSASPSKDLSKRASWGRGDESPRNTLKPDVGRQVSSSSAEGDSASHGATVRLKKPEVPKLLQDPHRQRLNSDSSDASSTISLPRKGRVGSFTQHSTDSEVGNGVQKPKSNQVKDAKTKTQTNSGDKIRTASPDKRVGSKLSSSPDRKPPKKSDPKASQEKKVSSSSTKTSTSQADKRSSYPPPKTTSAESKALTRRQSSPEKKLTRQPSPDKKLTRQPSPDKKVTKQPSSDKKLTRQPSPEKKASSKTLTDKKPSRQVSPEKQTSRTTSPEKRLSRTASTSSKTTVRAPSPDKRVSKTSSLERKDVRQPSPEKRPSTKRTASPVKKSSIKRDSDSESGSRSSSISKQKSSKDASKKEKKPEAAANADVIKEKKQVQEEVVQKKTEVQEEAAAPAKEPPKTLPIPTIVAPAPDRKPSHAKRIRSRTIAVDAPRRFGIADPKKKALEAKDEDLFAMMQLRAQQIREEEEKEGKMEEEEDETEDDRSVSEEKPQDVIKVSLKDRLQSFKGKESKATPIDFSKPPMPKSPKKSNKLEVPSKRPEPVNAKPEDAEGSSESDEDQLSSLSLSDKMKMFAEMSALQKKAQEEEKTRTKTRSQRFHKTRGSRERYQTQPVTPEELTSASSLAREMAAQAERKEIEEKRARGEIAREIKKEEEEDSIDTQERIRLEIQRNKLKEKAEKEEEEKEEEEKEEEVKEISRQEKIQEEIRQAKLLKEKMEKEKEKEEKVKEISRQEKVQEEIRQAKLLKEKEQQEARVQEEEKVTPKKDRIRDEIRQMKKEKEKGKEEKQEKKVKEISRQERVQEEIRQAKLLKEKEQQEAQVQEKEKEAPKKDRIQDEIRQMKKEKEKEKQKEKEEKQEEKVKEITRQERVQEEIRQAKLLKEKEKQEAKMQEEAKVAPKKDRLQDEIRQMKKEKEKEKQKEKVKIEEPKAPPTQDRIRDEIRQAKLTEKVEEEEIVKPKEAKNELKQDRIRDEIQQAKMKEKVEEEEPMEVETVATRERIREEIRQASVKAEVEKAYESDEGQLPSMAEEEEPAAEVKEDEYTKLTLSEKMKLFKERAVAPSQPPPKMQPPKRKRRNESRFKTQPITMEEVQKAAVSPLARSFSRPPSMEILGALPLAGQISMVYGDGAPLNGKAGSNGKEPGGPKMSPKLKKKGETEVLPKSYKDNIKKQKNLAALIASEIRETTQEVDEEEIEPKSDAVDMSIKMARLGHSVPSATETKSVEETSQTLPTEQSKAVPTPSTRNSISQESTASQQRQPPSPKMPLKDSRTQQQQQQQQQPSSPKQTKSQKPISSPERKIRKPQPTPRSPQNIRRNGSKDAAGSSSPVAPPRRGKVGSPSSMRRQDSNDADVSSGGEEVRKIQMDAARGSSSEHTTPQRDRKADKTRDQSSSESESEVRQRVSPVTEQHVAIIKKKHTQRVGPADKRDRNKTQPVSLGLVKEKEALSSSPGTGKKLTPRALRAQNPDRFKTQPVTPDELAELRRMMEPVTTASSIKDRLQALKKSGEEDWRKRISKYEDSPKSGIKERLNNLSYNSRFQKNNNEANDLPDNQSSITDRMQALKQNEATWKKRIEDKDVDAFTVSGKLKQAGKVSAEEANTTPQTKLKRSGSNRKPRPGSFRITIKRSDSDASNTSDTSKYENGTDFTSGMTTTTTESEDSEPDYRVIKKTVTVMKPDDEGFTDFFSSSSQWAEETVTTAPTPTTTSSMTTKTITTKKTQKTEETLSVSMSDFDALTEGTSQNSLHGIAAHRRSLRPERRTRPSANPLKAMKNRVNIVSEYTEERVELPDVETKKSKAEAKKENASKVARAGLASKEDIAQGKTKLSGVKDVREMGGSLAELLPYKDVMLIHVKGRRFVQVRLVEPRMTSMNSGDCFILVTAKEIFLWMGEYANVIEKSKASEIAQHIQQKKDLGCKAPTVCEIMETKQTTTHAKHWKRFTELLGGEAKYKDVGAPDEDELHEIYITETNMVYRVMGDSLEPYEAFWASPGKFKMLDTNEVFVFDFGSEIYIWRGKSSSKRKRKTAAQLAQLLWERGYDYSEYDVNPILPHDPKTMSGNERPEWTLVGKATQHMETVLFRHKFIDWPRETDGKKNGQEEGQKNDQAQELVPFDANLMIQPSREKPNLILEGTNLGRGDGLDSSNQVEERGTPAFFSQVDRKGQRINTLAVTVWHVLEYEHSTVPEECFGQFHEGDTYVIRWQYNVENTGMKSLKGTASKWGGTQGRERCAYFFWQGGRSTINEKGASALMTVELDAERGPQKQVVQGKEPAAFLQLFRGRMVVHVGKREDEETNTQGSLRLYCVRGEHLKETSLLEVPAKMRSLRSRTSFILLDLSSVHHKRASMFLWHGAKVSKPCRECAKHAAEQFKENIPLEAGLTSDCSVTLEEMEEGKEKAAFTKAIGKDRKSYDSAISDPLKYDYSPRLFHLSSGSGVFVSTEILYPSRSVEFPSPYPFLQSDLYSGEQPSLFALDNHYEIYLWQGWWPADHESASGTSKTGSATIRWDTDRKLAMETVMAYCKEKRPKNPPKAYLVYAGLEPLTFTNLFPYWEVREDVLKINKESGKRNDKAILVKDVLAKLTQATFTMEELSKRPLPEGVDPMKLETYLSNPEFKTVLSMTKDEFYKLPMWKQKNLKKNNALF